MKEKKGVMYRRSKVDGKKANIKRQEQIAWKEKRTVAPDARKEKK